MMEDTTNTRKNQVDEPKLQDFEVTYIRRSGNAATDWMAHLATPIDNLVENFSPLGLKLMEH